MFRVALLLSVVHLAQSVCPVTEPTTIGCDKATKEWQMKSSTVMRFAKPTPGKDYIGFITAPAGRKIEIRVKIAQSECTATCADQGLKLYLGTPEMPEKRICCAKDLNIVFTSNSNTLKVLPYNCSPNAQETKFLIEFRYVDAVAATTPRPTTPRPTTKKPNPKCVDSNEDCVSMDKDFQYCSDPMMQFRDKKMSCAKTCGLCGKKAPDCADQVEDCSQMKDAGMCVDDPITAEFWCAQTCGYCANPV